MARRTREAGVWRVRVANGGSLKISVIAASVIVFCALAYSSIPVAGASSESAESVHRHRLRHAVGAHSRSRRQGKEVSEMLIANGKGDVNKRDQDGKEEKCENQHKPIFTQCDEYNPTIQEEQPINTPLQLTVKASDADTDCGGNITYSLVDNKKFKIDPTTGVMFTNRVFDRDEPFREREEYVTVRAVDDGEQQLDDICVFKVTITDLNDNEPIFDKFLYNESVPRDAKVGNVVMRISATDIDNGRNGAVYYRIEAHPQAPDDVRYFSIIGESGEITLVKEIDSDKQSFLIYGVAIDGGVIPKSTRTKLNVYVVEQNRKPPTFVTQNIPIRLNETYSDNATPLKRIEALANDEEGEVFFELLTGLTESTNKGNVFTLEPESPTVSNLKLEGRLDYEAVTQYSLTIRAINKHKLAAELIITVDIIDENDEKPTFSDQIYPASVLENEPPGTFVTRVKAIDRDFSAPFHAVTYSIVSDRNKEDMFSIDSRTGDIRTLAMFDRETKETYSLRVAARDGANAPNADKPNERVTTIRIDIADKNDNGPSFVDPTAYAEIPEDADLNTKVLEVKALDIDTASQLVYTIEKGNTGNVFKIQHENSGRIIVAGKLDYETTKEYVLSVKASDGQNLPAEITVHVKVENRNDNPPVFDETTSSQQIQEEYVPSECIFEVRAYDPDINDRSVPQNISYQIDTGDEHFSVDKNGCVKIVHGLDRDPPNKPWKQVRVSGIDEHGTGLRGYKELNVTLLDINDNAPFLNSQNPVVWMENIRHGKVITLTADDIDTPENGPPFTFAIDQSANSDIRKKFELKGADLWTKEDNFDREAQKEYLIPIRITDSGSPAKSDISILKVIIGDENDNEMKPGTSKIFVYKYDPDSAFSIGRVYVDDPDDWDLPHKTFGWKTTEHPFFILDHGNGDISMRPQAPAGNYKLEFMVQDTTRNERAAGTVHVTVKEIPEQAVDQSGSLRLQGITKEDFVKLDSTGRSKADKLKSFVAKKFAIPEENVDVFTIIKSIHDNSSPDVFDVRFSAHGSPYYKAEKLDGVMSQNIRELEKELGLKVLMSRVDECLIEGRQHRAGCELSCTNVLTKSRRPYLVYTNTSMFVGVEAFADPKCQCSHELMPTTCDPNPCLHQGVCKRTQGMAGFQCECVSDNEIRKPRDSLGLGLGPRCERTQAQFEGKTYAWYRPLAVCDQATIEFTLSTAQTDALLMYNGPMYRSPLNVTDFLSVELRNGRPRLLVDFGSGVTQLETTKGLSDGIDHQISIRLSPTVIWMSIDGCSEKSEQCFAATKPPEGKKILNVNGPLQLGGLGLTTDELRFATGSRMVPTSKYYQGCIANLTINGEYYDLLEPSYTQNNHTIGICDKTTVMASTVLRVDPNFIIILIACILVMFLLIAGIVYFRRRHKYDDVKQGPDDEIRERIMHYSEEGGGEGDQTGYDMSVLMKPTGEAYIHPPLEELYDVSKPQMAQPGENPDIHSFLLNKQSKVDNDPEGLPYDDVRNYAYEGDGNSIGSLSSLASGTDEGDLNFDYLPTFGPRFKKLADMYGGQSSDDESYTNTGPNPEQWC